MASLIEKANKHIAEAEKALEVAETTRNSDLAEFELQRAIAHGILASTYIGKLK